MSDASAPSSKTFQFELVSPERILSSEPATMVVVPGTDGDFGVLADHAPLLSSLRPGVVDIRGVDGARKRVFVAGGFADVGQNTCSIMAEDAVAIEDISAAAVEQDIKNLTEDLGMAQDGVEKARIEDKISIARARLAAIAA